MTRSDAVRAATSIPVVFLMGPTASGKSALACSLAKRFPMEVISVDAAQVYRGLDIGTAKVGAVDRQNCAHHLIDIRNPDETYSAAQFSRDAMRLIDQVRARGRLPVLVGGTIFYFHTLLHGLPVMPGSDPILRADIASRAAAVGWPAMHRRLQALDPRRAGAIAPNDAQRIQRALEIVSLTGHAVPARRSVRRATPWPLIRLAFVPAMRTSLYRRIDARFREMINAGLVAEVARLRERYGTFPEPPSFKMVGYRQVSEYLAGKVGYNQMMEAGIVATRRLAKRQLTWLRNQPAVTWVDSDHARATEGVRLYLEANPLMAEFIRFGSA